MRETRADIIIVGAGMAGLAAARKLLDHGLEVQILEARDYIGGRVRTEFSPHLNFPLELGAEFIHGAYPASLNFLRAQGMPFFDMGDNHFERHRKKLVKTDFWKDIEKTVNKFRKWKKQDISLSEYFAQDKLLKPKARDYVRAYVEGFHSANADLIGVKSVAEAEGESPEINGQDSFRLLQGYRLMAENILNAEEKARIALNTKVKRIRWSENEVEVEAKREVEAFTLKASAVIVTLPIGVLKTNAVELDPRPRELDLALDKVHMGGITRLVFLFKRPFWEKMTEEPIGFLHASAGDFFPTWWTMFPVRAPILVAWQGGPRSWHLSQMSSEQRIEEALKTLSKMTGLSVRKLRSELEDVRAHDWNDDPFARGAYSYVGVDGVKKVARLARPFGKTLFFAGEGTQSGPMRGTVNGAITSGERAAEEILHFRGKK